MNSHPHMDCKDEIAVVHNGIIENYIELKKELENEGYTFKSETDTEVIPNLINYYYSKDNNNDELRIVRAVKLATERLIGSFVSCMAERMMLKKNIVIVAFSY